MSDFKVKLSLVLVGIGILLVILMKPFVLVDAGHTGVKLTFGAVSNEVLPEGFNWVLPWQSVVEVDNRIIKSEVKASSASKDLQTVTTVIAVNHRIKSNMSASIYKNIGLDYEANIITPSIQESVKKVTAKYTAEGLIKSREEVSLNIRNSLIKKLETYGLIIADFNIVDFQFSATFNAAIEAKQQAQQLSLKAEQDLLRVRIEAEQKIAEAQAEAEALRLKTLELNDKILMYEAIKTWNGQPPTVMGDSGNMLFNIPLTGGAN